MAKALTATAVMQLVESGELDLATPIGDHLPELRPDGPFEYSNANYDALALVVERVTGVNFGAHLRVRLLDPLEMQHTFVHPGRAADDGLVPGHYHWLGLGYRPFDAPMPPGMVGSATMFASAEDLAHLLAAHLGEGRYGDTRVLSGESVRRLHRPDPHPSDPDAGYAMGWLVHPAFPRDVVEHAPDLADLTVLSHTGEWSTTQSVMWMVPEAELGFVLLANGSDLADQTRLPQVGRGVRALLFGLDPPAVTPRSPLLQGLGKPLMLLLALGQALLAAWTAPWVRRLWHGAAPRGRVLTAVLLATGLDVAAVAVLVWVIPTVSEALLQGTFALPDFQILIVAMAVGVLWGIVRTGAVATGLTRRPNDAGGGTLLS